MIDPTIGDMHQMDDGDAQIRPAGWLANAIGVFVAIEFAVIIAVLKGWL